MVINVHSSSVRIGLSNTFTMETIPNHSPNVSCTKDWKAPMPDFFVELAFHGPAGGKGSVRRIFAADLATRSVVNLGSIVGSVVSSLVTDSGDTRGSSRIMSIVDILHLNDWRQREN